MTFCCISYSATFITLIHECYIDIIYIFFLLLPEFTLKASFNNVSVFDKV